MTRDRSRDVGSSNLPEAAKANTMTPEQQYINEMNQSAKGFGNFIRLVLIIILILTLIKLIW